MSSRVKHYFLAPIGNPAEGPIRLGNIVSAPRLADDPLNEDHVPLSSVSMDVVDHTEHSYDFGININNGSRVGVWASFLQTLGLGGDVTVEGSNENSEQWACESMRTISFTPKLDYITKCLEDEGVQNYMRVNKPWFGTSRLYMVTGIKVAYGASSTVRYAQSRGFHLRFGVDLTGLGIPLTIGPEFGRTNTLSVRQSQEGAEPFVFAFRLRRIKITGKGNIHHEQYDKGTVLGIKEDEVDESDVKFEVIVEGVEDDDADGSEFQLDSNDAVDEASPVGIECTCAASED
ncbi:hypothetical protein G7Z17_g1664 [Cylindrodendrum hubeiense]|uniref:Uncharacterized protein n=1 Tax=Cylindrodendrum hubeiense TaxID=595255 RepID=A0A9P5HLA5_9HYPO|nr:hypothetical protein G7Z17_g1664 [Cylindrodendrum hubeiense]